MKALSLWQPWATLCVLPMPCGWCDRSEAGAAAYEAHALTRRHGAIKWIETRSWAAPRNLIGQRFAIHAAKRRPDFAAMKSLIADRLEVWNAWHAGGLVSADGSLDIIPLGALVGTAVLTGCVPMTGSAVGGRRTLAIIDEPLPGGGTQIRLWDDDGRSCADVSDQLPFGDFALGRWAWLLADAKLLEEPIPCRGGQRVWNLPDDIAERLAA